MGCPAVPVPACQLLLLRWLRQTGMPIAQMTRFAELTRAGAHTIADRITLLEEHDQHVSKQIARLRDSQSQIHAKIRYYRSAHGADGQPAQTTDTR